MKGGTLFSGIGCAELSCPKIDWRWAAERDPDAKRDWGFAAAVHAARIGTRNHGSVEDADWKKIGRQEPIDVLVYGSPCQSFSVAGRRAGLDDSRGVLALEGLRVARELGVRWIVFENVPGLLSLDGGRTFGAYLGALAKLGYGWAYRILDARYAGVPQRRERLFVVGHLGDWRRAAAVLFEPHSLRWHPAPGSQAWPHPAGEVAETVGSGGRGPALQDAAAGLLVAGTLDAAAGRSRGAGTPISLIAPPVIASDGKHGKSRHEGVNLVEGVAHALNGCHTASGRFDPSETFVADVADPLCANEQRAYSHEGRGNFRLRNVVAFDPTQITHPENRSNPQPDGPAPSLAESAHVPVIGFTSKDHGQDAGDDVAPTLRSMNTPGHKNAGGQAAVAGAQLRRLTPLECERLQGLPDLYTFIWHRGKPAKDGPRYRAIGNGMAVPVIGWILERLRREHERSG